MSRKRIFISFAIEDKTSRDFLVGQARNVHVPFEFMDMSVKQPWDSSWKTQCRTRIRGCDGVVALISPNTTRAEGARWEMQCAREENIPMIGVQIHRNNRGTIPPELAGYQVIDWGWDGIASFINRLP